MNTAEEFLMAEYTTLKEFRASQLEQSQNRFNFFLALVSGAVAIIALVSDQSSSLSVSALLITIGTTALALLYLGVVTFRRIIQTHIRIVEYTRGMNRIRRYFVEHYPETAVYLTFSTDDTRPKLGTLGSLTIGATGLTSMVIFINTVLATVGFGFLLWQLMLSLGNEQPVLLGLLALLVVLLSLFGHRRYLRNQLIQADAELERKRAKLQSQIQPEVADHLQSPG